MVPWLHISRQLNFDRFLHASLQLAALRECTSVHEVEAMLAAFPYDIEDLYLLTWERIRNQTPAKALLAQTVLVWVLTATRSLTVEELQYAVATCSVTYKFQRSRLVHEDILVGICRGLVSIEEPTGLVRLVRESLYEPYLYLI